MGDVVTHYLGRTALSKRIFTGLQPRRLGKLVAELAGTWMAAEESRLRERRGHERLRASGAGPDHELVFAHRVIVTLVALRFQLPHAALAELYRVDRSTVTRAIREVRPLLAARGFAVPGRPGLQLRTLADVFAYALAHGVELRLDGTEVQVRRPRAGKPGRRAFVSGKKKMNTKKATVVTGGEGRTLWAGAFRPGRMHDQTAVRTEGIAGLFEQFPEVKAKVDAGYRGLAKEFPGQVQAPPFERYLREGRPVLLVGSSMVGKTRMAVRLIMAAFAERECLMPETREALAALGAAHSRMQGTVIFLDDIDRLLGAGGITQAEFDSLSRRNAVVGTIREHEYDGYLPTSQVRSPEWDVLSVFSRVFVHRNLSSQEEGRLHGTVEDAEICDRIIRTGIGDTLVPASTSLRRCAQGCRPARLAMRWSSEPRTGPAQA